MPCFVVEVFEGAVLIFLVRFTYMIFEYVVVRYLLVMKVNRRCDNAKETMRNDGVNAMVVAAMLRVIFLEAPCPVRFISVACNTGATEIWVATWPVFCENSNAKQSYFGE